MTKATMLKPIVKVGDTFQLLWAGARTISEIAAQDGVKVGSLLITTTQAEAYADAVRREALEEAAQACEARIGQHAPGMTPEDVEDCDEEARLCAGAIRALTPPQQ